MKGFVYILKDDKNIFYIGSTIDLKRRLNHHTSGHTHTTKRMKNVHLVFQQEFQSLDIARKIERKIKRLKRKDYIEKIVSEGYIKMRL